MNDYQQDVYRSQTQKGKKEQYIIIGDVHGCFQELVELLEQLGYGILKDSKAPYGYKINYPNNARQLVFVGDICDRGPEIMNSFKLVMTLIEDGQALCILGNHEAKFKKKLAGRNVQINHGLEDTVRELKDESPRFKKALTHFVNQLPIQLVLDDGRLVVAHAGLPEKYHGQVGKKIRVHALYGDVDGRRDEHGFPIRKDWTLNYRGDTVVVYGHVPREAVYVSNRTYGIDTGCVFGGCLTALYYPELEWIQVKAKETYVPHVYLYQDQTNVR